MSLKTMQIEAHPSMRFIAQPSFDTLGQLGRRDKDVSECVSELSVNELMAPITDSIDNAPLDLFIALSVPPGSALYGCIRELVVQIQVPPTYPLAPERYRMITPIVHPLVTPYWDNATAPKVRPRIGDDQDQNDKSDIYALDDEGGRMAFNKKDPGRLVSAKPVELLSWFLETLSNPVDCAKVFLEAHSTTSTALAYLGHLLPWALLENNPKALSAHVSQQLSPVMCLREQKRQRKERTLDSNGNYVESNALLVSHMIGLGLRWHPEIHAACPAAFKREVRALLMARQRAWWHVPMELVWLIIDALLRAHLAALLLSA